MAPESLLKRWAARPPSASTAAIAASAVALVLAAMTLAALGTGEKSLLIALRVTGRWSFLWFWMAYSIGSICTLAGPAARNWARSGREFGLGYTAAQTVHLGLLVWLYSIAAKSPVPQSVLVFFGVGIFWTYLLALFSFGGFARLFDSRVVRVLRTVGVYYIGFAFFQDLARNPLKENWLGLVLYLPFTALVGVAAILRIAAMTRRLASEQRSKQSFFVKKDQKTFIP